MCVKGVLLCVWSLRMLHGGSNCRHLVIYDYMSISLENEPLCCRAHSQKWPGVVIEPTHRCTGCHPVPQPLDREGRPFLRVKPDWGNWSYVMHLCERRLCDSLI